jgi:formylglycine-generating enzyme required for sulfatase activity
MFKPNLFALYNLCGNVAEMVVDWSNSNMISKGNENLPNVKLNGTAGGGWMNSAKEIKILAPDNHPNETKAHPNIGFRVVFTHFARGAEKINK